MKESKKLKVIGTTSAAVGYGAMVIWALVYGMLSKDWTALSIIMMITLLFAFVMGVVVMIVGYEKEMEEKARR